VCDHVGKALKLTSRLAHLAHLAYGKCRLLYMILHLPHRKCPTCHVIQYISETKDDDTLLAHVEVGDVDKVVQLLESKALSVDQRNEVSQ
jgi:hypothetical protein